MENRILHCFNWKIQDIKKSLNIIKDCGFTSILVSPLQKCKYDDNKCWWGLYQPYGNSSDYIGNSLGSKNDLKELCDESHKYEIKIIQDIVTAHTANDDYNELKPNDKVDKNLTNNKWFWKEKRNIENWNDMWQVKNLCMHLPGLDLSNYELQDIIITMLDEYKRIGINGFRVDAAKNISFSFFRRVMNRYKSEYNMAEVINEPNDMLNKYIELGINVLTNVTGGDHYKKIVFSESHDSYLNTDNNGYTRNTPEYIINRDYYELCKQYPNTIYYTRPFSDSWKSSIVREANLLHIK